MTRFVIALIALLVLLTSSSPVAAVPPADSTVAIDGAQLEAALARAGSHRGELEEALARVAADRRGGMEFLIAHMPERDCRTLSAEFLLENVDFAYRAWNEAPWKDTISEEIFLNEVLPYASINERRDRWRRDFYERFRSVMQEASSPAHAAALLNQRIFGELGVKYSTQRPKPDQSPYESMEAGTASCTGLSVLLIDACRALAVPARFVGTPRWSDGSGNHSWVEIWDGRWYFTGAAEPTGDELDRSWFLGRASQALRDDRMRAIYATSYRRTPQIFPLIWARDADYVHAVNVTDRYTSHGFELPEGKVRVRFRVLGDDGARLAAALNITGEHGETVFAGRTNDERFDANDHVTAILGQGGEYSAEVQVDGRSERRSFVAGDDEQLVTVRLRKASPTIAALQAHLRTAPQERPEIAGQEFARAPLSQEETERARELLWNDHVERLRRERAGEMRDRQLRFGDHVMPFHYQVFGDKPPTGRSLYISLHGGGGAPKRVNDQQWQNQQKLYEPGEGIYVAPRAPTDTWNLWHQAHIDPLFDRLIENMVVFEDVDPDRVYVMGYSAGGDGVYQLAPRMADRWAAAAMMAGHPNEASPLGLRNIGFALQVGGKDSAYQRNEVARNWAEQLADLRASDPGGYEHFVKIYPDKGHWMDREDAVALPWLARFRRNPVPDRVVWFQDDVCQQRFYWLAVPADERTRGARVTASYSDQRVELAVQGPGRLMIRLDDRMVDLDRPVVIAVGDRVLHDGPVERTIVTLARTLAERGDPRGMFSAEIPVTLRRTARF